MVLSCCAGVLEPRVPGSLNPKRLCERHSQNPDPADPDSPRWQVMALSCWVGLFNILAAVSTRYLWLFWWAGGGGTMAEAAATGPRTARQRRSQQQHRQSW
jgi:hypothetical protein